MLWLQQQMEHTEILASPNGSTLERANPHQLSLKFPETSKQERDCVFHSNHSLKTVSKLDHFPINFLKLF